MQSYLNLSKKKNFGKLFIFFDEGKHLKKINKKCNMVGSYNDSISGLIIQKRIANLIRSNAEFTFLILVAVWRRAFAYNFNKDGENRCFSVLDVHQLFYQLNSATILEKNYFNKQIIKMNYFLFYEIASFFYLIWFETF